PDDSRRTHNEHRLAARRHCVEISAALGRAVFEQSDQIRESTDQTHHAQQRQLDDLLRREVLSQRLLVVVGDRLMIRRELEGEAQPLPRIKADSSTESMTPRMWAGVMPRSAPSCSNTMRPVELSAPSATATHAQFPTSDSLPRSLSTGAMCWRCSCSDAVSSMVTSLSRSASVRWGT